MSAPDPVMMAALAACCDGDFDKAHALRDGLEKRGLMIVPISTIENVQTYIRSQRELRQIGLSETQAAAAIDLPSVPEAPSDETHEL